MERPNPRPPEKCAEGLIENPPQLILVFDNFRGRGKTKEDSAYETMELRASIAAFLYYSDLYQDDSQRPVICCLANKHLPNDKPGSEKIRQLLVTYGVPENKIIARSLTITTKTDISAQHALARELHIEGPTAIVTSIDHVARTEQEIVNHYLAHNSQTPIPKIYVISATTQELQAIDFFPNNQLPLSRRKQLDEIIDKELTGRLSHGPAEKIAYHLATGKYLRILQGPAEFISHRGSNSAEHDRQRESAAGKMIAAAKYWRYFKKQHKDLIDMENIKGYKEFCQKHPQLVLFPNVPAHG